MLKPLLALGLMFASTAAHASVPYYRFWRGWKAPVLNSQPLSDARFEQELDRIFVPMTVQSGGKRGLIAYLPVLPLQPAQLQKFRAQGIDVPDEVALVAYESEAAYLALRETPEGKAYQDLHRDYFDISKPPSPPRSRSLVPGQVAENTEFELDRAYDLLGSESSWQAEGAANRALVILHERRATDDGAYLKQIRQHANGLKQSASSQGLSSAVVLIAAQYWIEYQLWSQAPPPARDQAPGLHRISLRPHLFVEGAPAPLRWGGGLNLIFSPRPSAQRH